MLNRISDPTWPEIDAQDFDSTSNFIQRCCIYVMQQRWMLL
jgi:hypothetical protein